MFSVLAERDTLDTPLGLEETKKDTFFSDNW